MAGPKPEGMSGWPDNCYELLEVSKGASQEEITTAYYRLARVYHPDLYPLEQKPEIEAKSKLINDAYQVLGDEKKRKLYDKNLSRSQAKATPAQLLRHPSNIATKEPPLQPLLTGNIHITIPPEPRAERWGKPSPVRKGLSGGEFFWVIVLVLAVGLSLFYIMRTERLKKETKEAEYRANLGDNYKYMDVCTNGWRPRYGLAGIQEAVMLNCQDKIPASEWKKLDKSFLWSHKRSGVMLNSLFKHDETERFGKLIKKLTIEDITRKIVMPKNGPNREQHTNLFLLLAAQRELNFDRWPPAQIPFELWGNKYRFEAWTGEGHVYKNALEFVLEYGSIWKDAFHHRRWKGHVKTLEKLGIDARKIVDGAPKNEYLGEEIKEYFDEQIQLARKT